MSGTISIKFLSEETGSTRENIKQWLMEVGHDPHALVMEKHDEYVSLIKAHKKNKVAIGQGKSDAKPHFDKDGLSWAESLKRQETLRLQRENRIADKLLAEEWLSANAHHQILASLCGKLETIPDKAKAQMGLTETQTVALQKLIDEARSDASSETRSAFMDGRKKAESAGRK